MIIHNVHANGICLTPDRICVGTKGSFGLAKIAFSFSSDWDGSIKKAVFYPVRGKPIEVLISDSVPEIDVPPEVTAYSGVSKYVVSGVFGDETNLEAKSITLTGELLTESTLEDRSTNAKKVTPDNFTQLLMQVKTDIEAALQAAKDSGEFDGADGADGVSPKVNLERFDKFLRLTITDVDGIYTGDIYDGADGVQGLPGENGVSPICTLAREGDTVTLTITDVEGVKTAEIHDGADGADGKDGKDGESGIYVSTTEIELPPDGYQVWVILGETGETSAIKVLSDGTWVNVPGVQVDIGYVEECMRKAEDAAIRSESSADKAQEISDNLLVSFHAPPLELLNEAIVLTTGTIQEFVINNPK